MSGGVDTMSAEHLGGDAVPAHLVGGVAGGHRPVAGHHRYLRHSLRHHYTLHERHLYKWRGERRFVYKYSTTNETLIHFLIFF